MKVDLFVIFNEKCNIIVIVIVLLLLFLDPSFNSFKSLFDSSIQNLLSRLA